MKKPTPAPAAADDAAAPLFISKSPRFTSIDLQWPIAYRGKEYHSIRLVRLTVAEVAAFQESITDLAPNAKVRWPIYRDERMETIPDAVLDALDDDDSFRLEEIVRDFLPRRFQAAPASGLDPRNGADTGSQSDASQA